MIEQSRPAIRYTFQDGEVVLEASGNDTAAASESVPIELTGDEIVTPLKPQFLLDALAGVHTEFVRVAFTKNSNDASKLGPVLISSHGAKEASDSDSYRYLLQPNLQQR